MLYVRLSAGKWSVVEDLYIDERSRTLIQANITELEQEFTVRDKARTAPGYLGGGEHGRLEEGKVEKGEEAAEQEYQQFGELRLPVLSASALRSLLKGLRNAASVRKDRAGRAGARGGRAVGLIERAGAGGRRTGGPRGGPRRRCLVRMVIMVWCQLLVLQSATLFSAPAAVAFVYIPCCS